MLLLLFQANAGAILGTLSVTLDDVTVSATGTVALSAQAGITLDDTTISATGTLALTGSVAITLDDASVNATGTLAIVGTESTTLDDATLVATGTLTISGAASVTLDDASLTSTAVVVNQGALNVTLDDVALFADSTLRLPNHGAFAPVKKAGPKKNSKQERERLLNQALTKAFEPKRRKVVKELPWLAEPIPPPVVLPVPEFNPNLAALHGEMANLQQQLAALQFNRSQEEADIELLLMAL